MNSDAPVAIEAFCGAGGLSLGLHMAGFRVPAAFDNNPIAIETYRQNLGGSAFIADIRHVTVKELEKAAGADKESFALIAGGAPCQGFSVQRRDGEDDLRNNLPLAFLNLVLGVMPPFFLFENVPGIRGRHGQQILKRFIKTATDAGYVCHSRVLDAVNYGVPQSRKRLFVVGELAKDGQTWFDFPSPITDEKSEETKVGYAFRGIPEPPQDGSPHPDVPNHRRTRLSPLNSKRLSLVPQGGGMQDLPPEMRVACHRDGPARIGHRYVYGRLHWDRPSGTITARFDSFTRGKFAHPLNNRNITLREGARLQSFPDDYVFRGQQEEVAAQIGNAVPPKLAMYIGRALLDAMIQRQKSKLCLTITPKQPRGGGAGPSQA